MNHQGQSDDYSSQPKLASIDPVAGTASRAAALHRQFTGALAHQRGDEILWDCGAHGEKLR